MGVFGAFSVVNVEKNCPALGERMLIEVNNVMYAKTEIQNLEYKHRTPSRPATLNSHNIWISSDKDYYLLECTSEHRHNPSIKQS